MSNKELIFVYNADSGKWNGYLDMMHKVFSPKTYPCQLCAITYGTFSMKKEWGEFVDQLPLPVRFLHRDEWEKEFARQDELPAVFLKHGEDITVWIDAESMNKMSLDKLRSYITLRINELG